MRYRKYECLSLWQHACSPINRIGSNNCDARLAIGIRGEIAKAGDSANVGSGERKKAEAATTLVRKESAVKGVSFELVELDLANLKSGRDCANHLLERGEPFDVVIANAGVMATPLAVRLTASRRSSAPITWATLYWSTGLLLLSVQVVG